jgi:signal transduction histidine kinase
MQSLHSKIILAFGSLSLLMALLALLAFSNMAYLEQRVDQGLVVSRLEHGVMEMRLQEKNLFLYNNLAAGEEARLQAAAVMALMDAEQAQLVSLSDAALLARFRQILADYRAALGRYLSQDSPGAEDKALIRAQGHSAAELASQLTASERRTLSSAIATAHWGMALSILILALMVVALGRWLARRVVSPLRQLTQDLAPIAAGHFDHLSLTHADAEMLAFGEAFNRMLQELELRQRRLAQSEKLAALGVLIAGVAHELNNPISNISTTAQLLLEEHAEAGPAQLAEWAGMIDAETARAQRIIAALQGYGKQGLAEPVPLRLAELIHSCQPLLDGLLRQHQARLSLDIDPELQVIADAQRLQQALINLVQNAALSGEAVQIEISAGPCASDPAPPAEAGVVLGEPGGCGRSWPLCRLLIRDSGQGIAAEDLPRVFEPFYSRRQRGAGMGLGLYIVQEIIQEHQGCIALASNPGQGTSVWLYLPCVTGEAAA